MPLEARDEGGVEVVGVRLTSWALVELRAARDQRGDEGDADVAAHVARQVDDARDLVVLLGRDAGVDERC